MSRLRLDSKAKDGGTSLPSLSFLKSSDIAKFDREDMSALLVDPDLKLGEMRDSLLQTCLSHERSETKLNEKKMTHRLTRRPSEGGERVVEEELPVLNSLSRVQLEAMKKRELENLLRAHGPTPGFFNLSSSTTSHRSK